MTISSCKQIKVLKFYICYKLLSLILGTVDKHNSEANVEF